MLAARLDQLGREERSVLERGAVEGKVFHRGAVLELSPETDRLRVDGLLQGLVQQELVRPNRADFADERAFRFSHQLLRDVAYESLSKTVRAELHERFADWLEEQTGERADEFDEILGHHLQAAYRYRADLGPVDEGGHVLGARAAHRLGNAGLRAHARGDMWGASKLLSSAVALLPRDDVTRLQPKLEDALFETGERRQRGMSWASLRCFWRRPLGHPWELKERGGKAMLRCPSCGNVKRYRGSIGPTRGFTLTSSKTGMYNTDSQRQPPGGETAGGGGQ